MVPGSAQLPAGVVLVRADNPGPMTLEGTNTWVVDGPHGVLVVDPGPLDEQHLAAVRLAAASTGPVAGIVVTHRHADHAAGAERFAGLTGAPLVAPTADGQPLPGGAARWLTTPGHTDDSGCVLLDGAVLTGDTVLGRGTTVIDGRAGGSLADYLASLERLAGLGELTVLPGHGPVLPSLREVASALLAHRRERVEHVRAARLAGATTAEEVVAAVYPGLADDLTFAAVLSTQAALDHLDAEVSPPGG
ncbi:glyoxylase-like metal-dependent hydrolase (beta-lactamase superfamily II) [Motilibacter peucedani]|uniref:Glyoxylase-like metal-dependent hydrolase (Beta-lactamase superfamily II) n=1 Tax=Motilibacter peucedani TaxID=598650 RepID=A0A420XQ57_9ACTN|nr:MBL fold metallo-hydrolase [Motilibacter peucedani]RKS75387.1 glyoxylase-like metal-dependent hydrolase (beta-lactamase superfamily II) [Motilibacter peucedani]